MSEAPSSVWVEPRTLASFADDGKVHTTEIGERHVRKPSARIRTVKPAYVGRAIRNSNGKVTLLAVYAAYCGSCRRSMPTVAELARKHRARRLAVKAFSVDPNAEMFRAYAGQFRGAFDLVRVKQTRSHRVSTQLRKLGMNVGSPMTIPRFGLFDDRGRLVAESNRITRLSDRIEKLL